MIDDVQGNDKTTKDSEIDNKIEHIKELIEEENELREKEKINEEFYEKKCCYKEGFLGYIQEILVIVIIKIVFIFIEILLNKLVLFKNNNYINLVKNSSKSLTNFEKFWCNAGNAEFIGLIIYFAFLIILVIFSLIYTYIKRRSLSNEDIIKNKNKIIVIYFPLYILFYIFFTLISYLIVYSIIFISISPIEYPGVFNIADKSKKLTLDEEIEIEDAVDKFKKSKHIHIIYIIISFIILYLNILIINLIYKSIIFVLEKDEAIKKGDIKKDEEEDKKDGLTEDSKKDKSEKSEKEIDIDIHKKEQQKIKLKEQKEYNWKYPDINSEFTLLESYYLGLFFILHLSISLFKLNINEEENYQELLFSVEENKMESPKNYSILKMYGNFERSVTISFFVLNSICFGIIIFLMFKKMLYDIFPKCLNPFIPKIMLLVLNIIYFIFIILLIIFSGLCLSSFNALDESKSINFFVVKNKLIGQIIVYIFILVFLAIIIIDYFRFIFCFCFEKRSNKRDNRVKNKNKEKSLSETKGSTSRRGLNINYLTTE